MKHCIDDYMMPLTARQCQLDQISIKQPSLKELEKYFEFLASGLFGPAFLRAALSIAVINL